MLQLLHARGFIDYTRLRVTGGGVIKSACIIYDFARANCPGGLNPALDFTSIIGARRGAPAASRNAIKRITVSANAQFSLSFFSRDASLNIQLFTESSELVISFAAQRVKVNRSRSEAAVAASSPSTSLTNLVKRKLSREFSIWTS